MPASDQSKSYEETCRQDDHTCKGGHTSCKAAGVYCIMLQACVSMLMHAHAYHCAILDVNTHPCVNSIA